MPSSAAGAAACLRSGRLAWRHPAPSGDRMPAPTISAGWAMELLANIDVDDLNVAIDFYSRALGLTVGRRFGALRAQRCWAHRARSTYWRNPPTATPAARGQRPRVTTRATGRRCISTSSCRTSIAACTRAQAAGATSGRADAHARVGTHRGVRRPVRTRVLPDPVPEPRLRRDRELEETALPRLRSSAA